MAAYFLGKEVGRPLSDGVGFWLSAPRYSAAGSVLSSVLPREFAGNRPLEETFGRISLCFLVSLTGKSRIHA